MPFNYTTGNPDDLVAGSPADMNDIQGPFYDLRTWLNSGPAAPPPVVTVLPGAPVDGAEVFLLADSANGVLWHLRYRASSASAYKWEYVGGSAMSVEILTNEATASAAYVDLATAGPQVIVPVAGDYEMSFGAFFWRAWPVAAVSGMALKLGAAVASDNEGIFAATMADAASAVQGGSHARTMRRTLTAGLNVRAQYNSSVGTANFGRRFLHVRPARVG